MKRCSPERITGAIQIRLQDSALLFLLLEEVDPLVRDFPTPVSLTHLGNLPSNPSKEPTEWLIQLILILADLANLSSTKMAIDLVCCLQIRMSKPKHYVFQSLVLSANHPKGDRMLERMRRDLGRIAPPTLDPIRSDTRLFGGSCDDVPNGAISHPSGLP